MIHFWIAKNHRRLLQCTAGLVLGSFLFTTISAPFAEGSLWKERKSYLQMAQAPINPQPLPLLNLSQVLTQKFSAKYNIPTASSHLSDIAFSLSSLPGTIRKISVPQKGKQGPIVLHIQDVHLNQEAQGNIGKTIQGLVNADKISLVALEGAFEKIDLSRFRRSPYPEAIQKVADYLLRENKISGALHTAFTSRKEIPPMVGIDDENHYHANVNAYKKSYELASSNLKNLLAIQSELENEKGKVFNADLKVFDQKAQSFHAGKIKLAEYLDFLVEESLCEDQNDRRMNSQNEIVPKHKCQDKTVQNFIKCAKIESSLDFKKVEKERSQLIQALVRNLNESQIEELTQQSLAYRLGNIGYADYYGFIQNLCKSNKIVLIQYPAMDQYIQYTLLADSINSEELFKKIKEIEEEGYEHLAKTALEKELIFKSKQSYLTRKLLEFTLTPEEWKEYEKLRGHFFNLSRKEQTFSESSNHSLLDLNSFEDFYREAKIRDQAMAGNLLREIELHDLGFSTVYSSAKTTNKEFREMQSRKQKSKVVLLVTGGFHSEGIENRLIQEGMTVINFAPKMTKVELENGAAHLTVFTQEKTPLEKLFKGEKLTLPPKTFPKQLLPIAAALVIGFLAIWSPQMTSPAQANTANRILLGQEVAEETKVEKVKWLEPRTSQLFLQKPNGTVKVTVNSDEKKDITVKEETFKSFGSELNQWYEGLLQKILRPYKKIVYKRLSQKVLTPYRKGVIKIKKIYGENRPFGSKSDPDSMPLSGFIPPLATTRRDDESAEDSDGKVNINTASREQLIALFGKIIHPKREGKRLEAIVNRLLERRPFSSLDHLSSVPGIGSGSTFREIKAQLADQISFGAIEQNNVALPDENRTGTGIVEFLEFRDKTIELLETFCLSFSASLPLGTRSTVEDWVIHIRNASSAQELLKALEALSLVPTEDEQLILDGVRNFFLQKYGVEKFPIILVQPLAVQSMGDVIPGLYSQNSEEGVIEYWKVLFTNIIFSGFYGAPGMTGTFLDHMQKKPFIVFTRQASPELLLYYLTHEAHHVRQPRSVPRVKISEGEKKLEIPSILHRFLFEAYAEFSALGDLPAISAQLPLNLDCSRFYEPNFKGGSPYYAGLLFIESIIKQKSIPINFEAIEQVALRDDFTLMIKQLGKARWELFSNIAKNLTVNPRFLEMREYDLLVVMNSLVALTLSLDQYRVAVNRLRAMPYVLAALNPNEEIKNVIRNAVSRTGFQISEVQIGEMLLEIYGFVNSKNMDFALADEVIERGVNLANAKNIVGRYLSDCAMSMVRGGWLQKFRKSGAQPGALGLWKMLGMNMDLTVIGVIEGFIIVYAMTLFMPYTSPEFTYKFISLIAQGTLFAILTVYSITFLLHLFSGVQQPSGKILRWSFFKGSDARFEKVSFREAFHAGLEATNNATFKSAFQIFPLLWISVFLPSPWSYLVTVIATIFGALPHFFINERIKQAYGTFNLDVLTETYDSPNRIEDGDSHGSTGSTADIQNEIQHYPLDGAQGPVLSDTTREEDHRYVYDPVMKKVILNQLETELAFPHKSEFVHTRNEITEIFQKLLESASELLEEKGKIEQLAGLRELKIYLSDTLTPNASAVFQHNFMILNIGTLRQLSKKGLLSKDAVAFILAHELSHMLQYRDDVDEGKINREKVNFRSWKETIKEKFYEHKERYTREQDADIRALEIVNRAGYNMSATVSFFESIQKNSFSFEQMLHEHPSPQTRIDYIKKILRASNWRESQTLEKFSDAVLEEMNAPQSLMRRRQEQLSLIVNQKDLEFAIENAQTIEELDLIVSWSLSRALELESKKIAPLVLKLLLKRKDKVLKGLFRFVVKASRIDLYTHLWIHKNERYKDRYEPQGLFWFLFTKMSLIKKKVSYFIFTYLVTDSLPIYEANDRTKGFYSRVPLFIDGYDRLFDAIKEEQIIQEKIKLRNQILQKIRAKALELENGNEKSIELVRLEALRMNPLLVSNASFSGEGYDIPFSYRHERITKEKIRKIEKGLEESISQYSSQELTIFLRQMLPFRGMGFEYIRIWDKDERSDFNDYLATVNEARWSVYEVMVSFMLKRLVLDLKNPSSGQLLELLDLLLLKKREFLGKLTPKIDHVARWILKRIRKILAQTIQNQREEHLKVKQYFADHWQLYPLREIGEFFYEELLMDPADPLTLKLLQKSENLRNNVFSVLIRTLKGANARELLFEDEVMNYQMERVIRFFRLDDAQITLLHAAVAQKIAESRREDQSRNRLIEIQESFSSLERSGINEKPLEYDPLSRQLAELLFDQDQLNEDGLANIFGFVTDNNRATSNRLNPSEIETVNQKVREALDEAGLFINDLASLNFEIKKIIYFFYLGGIQEADFLIKFARAAYKRRSIHQNDLELLAQFLNSPSFLEKQKRRGVPKTFSAERVRWKGFGRFLGSEENMSPDMFLVMKPFYRPQTWGEYIVSFNLMVYLQRTKQKRLVRFLIDSLFLKKISSIFSMFLGELWGGDDSDWYSDGPTTSKFLMRIFESAFSKIIFGAPKYIDRRDLALDSSWKRFFLTLVFKSKMNFEELLSEIKTYFPEGIFRNFLLFYLLAKRIHELDPSFKLKKLPEPKDLKEFFLKSSQFAKEKTLILEAVEKITPLLIRDHRIDFINLKLLSYWFLKKEGKKKSGLGENERGSLYNFFIDLGGFLDLLVWGLEKLYELWKKSDLYTFLTFTVHLINYVLILPFYVLSEARLLPKFLYKLVVCILLIKSPFGDTDRAYLSLKNRVMEIVLSEIYRERWMMRLFRRFYLWFYMRFRSKEKLSSIFYFDFQGKQVHLDSSIPDFVERDLMAIIHKFELSFKTKKEYIQRLFSIETPTRDKYLESLAEEEISRTDQTQDDLLDHLKSLRTLFANPYLKDHYSLICLELERKINSDLYRMNQDQGSVDPKTHFELIKNYVELIQSYFEVGYIRDDLLFPVLEEARTHEEYLLIRPLFFQYRMNGIQDQKKSDSFYYQDRVALLLQEAKAEEKKELLLWVLGFQEKPLFLSEWEIFVKTDLSHLKEVFRGNGHVPFKQEREPISFFNTGHSLRKEMVRQLLVGSKGILTDKKIFESMMNAIFDSIVSKGGEISKKKIKKIMRSVIRNLDNERLIEMTQALSVTLSLREGGEDESVVIAKFFESLGVIGIKLAQVLAHSYDIQISEHLRDRLRDLSSGADPVNKILAFETIQNIYPGGFNAHFDTLGDMIGSASVKVVYKVNRKGMEKPHVLKIKRPDVSQRIEKDLEFLKSILKDLRKKGFSISPGLENEVAKAIRKDADFKREFEITEEFREQIQRIQEEEHYHLQDQTPVEFSVARIHAGSIQSDATMETELAQGVSLDKEDEIIQSGILDKSDYVEVKRIILDFLMKQLFQYGFYLSDPHGGNFHIVREDGKIKIILIDNGSGEKLEEGENNKEELLESMIWLSINSGRRIPNQYLSASIFFGKLGYLKKDLTSLEFLTLIFKYLKISGTREDGSSFILTPEEYLESIKVKFEQKMTPLEKIRFLLREKERSKASENRVPNQQSLSTSHSESLMDGQEEDHSSNHPGGILGSVKFLVLGLAQSLLPKKWKSAFSVIYDLFIVFWLENLLLRYFVKPHLPFILHGLSPVLHVFGLDSISLNAALWGIFFGLHLIEFLLFRSINWLEYAIFQTQNSPRAPPKENILASGIVSVLSAFFTSSPTSLESFGIHFLVNFAAFLISINIYGLIKNRIATIWVSQLLKEHYEIGKIADVDRIKKTRNGFTYWIATKDHKMFILSYRKVDPDFVDFESLIRGAPHKEDLVAKLIPTQSGRNYIPYKEGLLTLEEYLSGRAGEWGEFKGPQLEDAAYFLAKFQEATADLVSLTSSPRWNYKLPVILLHKLEDTQNKFEAIYASLRERGPPQKLNELERTFLERYPFFMQHLKILKDQMQSKIGELERSVVHGDYHPLNIILSNTIVSSIVDFGYSHIGPRIFDLANPITETDHKFDWNKALKFVQAFDNFSKKPLTKIEKELLPEMYRRLYLQTILMVGESLVRRAKWNVKHRKRLLLNAVEFLEHFQDYSWSELAGPSDTAEHHKPMVQTFGNDVEFALEISEDAFEESGKGKIFFDRVQNHTYIGDEEIEFGSQALSKLMSNIATLKERYEKNHKDYEVLAILPNGNLGFNDWFVGIINGKVYHHAKEPLRDRTYSMVVTKIDGTSSTKELHFKEISGVIRAYDGEDQDITDKIKYAFFGQQIVKDGKYNLEEITEQFDDIRHVLRLPMFKSEKFSGDGRFYFGFSDGRGELLEQDKDKLDDAARGEPVSLSLRPLMEAGISPEERERVFAQWGYKNVTDIEGKSYFNLNRGEYIIASFNQIYIKFYPGVNPHTLVGFTKEGKILTAGVEGNTDQAGATLPELAFDLICRGAKDVFLWANGKDSKIELMDNKMEAKGARKQFLELLMIVRKKGGGVEPKSKSQPFKNDQLDNQSDGSHFEPESGQAGFSTGGSGHYKNLSNYQNNETPHHQGAMQYPTKENINGKSEQLGSSENQNDSKAEDSALKIINILQGIETDLDIDTIRGVVHTEEFEKSLKEKGAEAGLELTEEEVVKRLIAATPHADVDKSNADLYIIREAISEKNLQKILSGLQQKRTSILITETSELKSRIEQRIENLKLKEHLKLFVISAEEFGKERIIREGSTLVLKNLHDLLTNHNRLKNVISHLTGLNIAVDSSLKRDYEGLPENSLLRSKNTIYLLLDELFKALPVRAIDLEPIDRIARIVASSA
ncbi:MAG: phosphotransferase [Elusimicrobia bacterium]|nr:phosphotransferase [Elusimicrobiota bacterium]